MDTECAKRGAGKETRSVMCNKNVIKQKKKNIKNVSD